MIGAASLGRLSSAGMVVALVSLSVTACGGGRPVTAPSGQSSDRSAALVVDKDRDYDGSPRNRYDPDDYKILAYGREADPAERETVTAMLTHYFRYAASTNGARACKLMSGPLKESVLELYGPQKDPSAPRQGTCVAVATYIFRQRRRHLQIEAATIVVKDVRLGEEFGYAILSFKGLPDRHMLLYREAGRWRLDEPFDERLV